MPVPDASVRLDAGYTTLQAAPDGSIDGGGRDGLYDVDARIVRCLRYRMGEEPLRLVGSSAVAPHRWIGVLVGRPPDASDGATGPALPQDAVELRIERLVGGGLLDRLTLTNHAGAPVDAELTIEIDVDVEDVLEVGDERRQQGTLERDDGRLEITWRYRVVREGRRLERGIRARLEGAGDGGQVRRHGFVAALRLAPHETRELRLIVESQVDGAWRHPRSDEHDAWLTSWASRRARVEAPASAAAEAIERAATDLGGLRNDDVLGTRSDDAWFPNAGVPMFTGLFGRDTLVAAWQAALLGPELLRGTIEAIARTQATTDDPWRDAKPGKLIHELRRGPLSALGVVPQDAYYGSQTTGALFPFALSEHWHWTGDTRFVRRHLPAARRVFAWADRDGDLNGDGFLEYRKRSPEGLTNQAWKDSAEAIRYGDGRNVEPPIATVEEQAFHILALERMAELLTATGDRADARRYLERARALRRRWHDAFWWAEEGFYALALDAEGEAVRTVASNAGHALAAGIVPRRHARAVAERLLGDDLFTGWGVRTLSSRHPSYNPYAYHLGTLWPVEQATFALGLRRYGFDDLADRLIDGMLEAAVRAPDGRLPEVLAGVDRSVAPEPLLYPRANSPQAWSASATVQLLQVSLGLYPFAPLRLLMVVRPRLPASIPEVTLRGIRVGRARLSLAFRRRDDGSADWRVAERDGRVLAVSAPPPNASPGSFGERVAHAALRSVRGRRLDAARIAFAIGVP